MLLVRCELACQSCPTIHMLFHHAPIYLAPAIIAKAESEVVPDIQRLKPGSGQKHIHIVLLHDIDIAHVGQCFHKVLLYQAEVILSTVEAEYGNLIYPSCPPALDLFVASY